LVPSTKGKNKLVIDAKTVIAKIPKIKNPSLDLSLRELFFQDKIIMTIENTNEIIKYTKKILYKGPVFTLETRLTISTDGIK
jgi:hypothetical protein